MIFLLLFILQILILYFLSRNLKGKLFNFFYKLTKRKKVSTYLFAILFLPGTYFHELAHGLAARILFVPVGNLKLKPQVEENKIKLGSVAIAKVDPFRRTIIGIAPFLIGTITIFVSLYLATAYNLLHSPLTIIIIGYLVFQIGNSMFSSKKDLEEAWKVMLVLLAIFISIHLLGFRIDIKSIFSKEAIETIKTANLYLLVPLIINLIILSLLRLAKI